MENVTLNRYYSDASVRAELDAAARRERARMLKRFLEQAAHALLRDRKDTGRAPVLQRAQPCEAC